MFGFLNDWFGGFKYTPAPAPFMPGSYQDHYEYYSPPPMMGSPFAPPDPYTWLPKGEPMGMRDETPSLPPGFTANTLAPTAFAKMGAIPGIGPFIAAGPIMAALAGAGVGATVGGLSGALIGMGIPEYEAKQYESKIAGGNILISVHSENSDERSRAKEIFERCGAHDISYTEEEGVSQKDQRDAAPGFRA